MALKTGVIGAGKIGRIHAQILAQMSNSELVGICSRSAESATRLAAEHGVRGYTNVRQMVDETGVEVLIVATPHPNHAEAAIPALEQGVHVLVEKPLSASLEDCERIQAAAHNSGAKLGVISQRRWLEPVQRLKQAIVTGKIGTPVLGMVQLLGWRDEAYYASDPWRGRWDTEGGGVLINQAPHQLDLLLWFMGEVEEIFGWWQNFNHPYIEVEDTSVAVIRFKSGALGNIVASNSQKPGLYGKVHIHGQNGASIGVQTDGGAMFIAGMTPVLEPPINDLWTVPDETQLLTSWQEQDKHFFTTIDPVKHYLRLQIEDFIAAVQMNRTPAVTGEDGRRVVELIKAIYASQRMGTPLKIPTSSLP